MLKPANPLLGETFEYPLRHIIMLLRALDRLRFTYTRF
jgi:hypothetical protein